MMRIRTALAFVLGATVGCITLVGYALTSLIPHQRTWHE